MSLHSKIFVPSTEDSQKALSRTTHLGIGAHPDDLEIMAFHGITTCYKNPSAHFTGIILADGAHSPRSGRFEKVTDEEMVIIRAKEQMRASFKGEYNAVAMLGAKSSDIKAQKSFVQEELEEVLSRMQPEVVYTHSLCDEHDTHVACALIVLNALKKIKNPKLKHVFGCEVWGDLDWLPDSKKIKLDVSGHDALAAQLLNVFESQIEGGKRYDLATLGRRRAQATFSSAHETDRVKSSILAMDLSPLVKSKLEPDKYIDSLISEFKSLKLLRLKGLLK